MAPWIISHFPPHQNYVEPCGGAASVLLQKPRSPLETYNDLDGNVVNFFRVLRDIPDELIRKIRLTPWARAEYELSLEPCEDVVERARRFFTASMMSLHRGTDSGLSGWKYWRRQNAFGDCPEQQMGIIQHLSDVADRLITVQIENRGALDILARYNVSNKTLFYFDPPYVSDTRYRKRAYEEETDDQFHVQSAALLRQCQGYVVVSGYACDLYAELYEAHGWHRVDKEAQTNSGGKRIESLWLSPRTVEALGKPEQGQLL